MTDRTDAGPAADADGQPDPRTDSRGVEVDRPSLVKTPRPEAGRTGEVPPPAAPPPAAPPPDEPPPDESPGRPERQRSLWRELPVLVIVAVGLALLIKTFFLQAFFIPSGSMEQTLAVGDRVLVNKLVYDFREPHRGEIVVFNGEGTGFPKEVTLVEPSNPVGRFLRNAQSFLGLGSFDESDFIKRVIGVGGDRISCPGTAEDPTKCLNVLVNGKKIDESAYLYETQTFTLPFQEAFTERTVPAGQLFVMGDHRDDSNDSRPNGTVPVDNVIGRAFVTVWPVGNFSGHPVPGTFDGQSLTASAGTPLAVRAAGSAALPPVAGLLLATPLVAGRRRLTARRRRRHPARGRTPGSTA